MERRILKQLTIAALFYAGAAHGLVVSDPGAYARMADALKNAQEQLSKMAEQVQELTKAKETLFDIKGQLEGTYNRSAGIYSEIKDLEKATKGAGIDPLLKGGDYGKDYKDLDTLLNEVFVDPRDKEYNAWLLKDAKAETRQNVYKNSIKRAEIELNDMEKRIRRINQLGDSIDTTQNQKDAQDLANRLLVEMLLGQERMISILSNLAQAYAISQYAGVSQTSESSKNTQITKKSKGKNMLLEGCKKDGYNCSAGELNRIFETGEIGH